MGGESDQWYPNLVYDNHPMTQPYSPEDGYHLSKDLADKAIEFIRDARTIAPEKPWFMYSCPGAALELYGRSFSPLAEVTIDSPKKAEGVIFAGGGRRAAGGWAATRSS